jgi:hypothetical protein
MYTKDQLETHQPKPLNDRRMSDEIKNILEGKIDRDISDSIYDEFINETEKYIFSSSNNTFRGYQSFKRKDIIVGCTQYIDNLYMQGPVQVLKGDYRYHERLGNKAIDLSELQSETPVIIAMPFPRIGDKLPNMERILDHCHEKNILVHIDGAWVTCARNIDFNFNHPAIESFAISLSKGLGLGWNRVGIRWHRNSDPNDAISIMNDHMMNLKVVVKIGLHFVRSFPIDYVWNKHGERYSKVCKDFSLQETNSIHLAMSQGEPVGVSKLINYLEQNGH